MPSVCCSNCDKYKKMLHNYCKMCGFHLTKGYVQYVRRVSCNYTTERFCGYCGKLIRSGCKC